MKYSVESSLLEVRLMSHQSDYSLFDIIICGLTEIFLNCPGNRQNAVSVSLVNYVNNQCRRLISVRLQMNGKKGNCALYIIRLLMF